MRVTTDDLLETIGFSSVSVVCTEADEGTAFDSFVIVGRVNIDAVI